MPFSQSSQISSIVGFAESLRPSSVLDIGTGMGQYGFLLRTNLENVNLFVVDGDKAEQRRRDEWLVKIDGIEGYEKYITPVHAYSYNNITIGDALDILRSVKNSSYELVIAIDILEHFEFSEGLRLLAECSRIASRAVLVSTPKSFIVQDVPANPLENHRSLWAAKDLRDAGYREIIQNPHSWIAVLRK